MTFLPQEIIRRKRDGHALTVAELDAFVAGITAGTVSDGQAAAFAMAVFFRGMEPAECAALTRAMAQSGTRLAWDLPGPVVDKHSTGGIGDTVSLVLAPALAACGAYVPMIAGRGLGHTGGTVDKLEAIPGYRTAPDIDLFRRAVREAGCAIIGQTQEIAPADRRLYAIRDVTATVESLPLITASILSKKLAAGLDALVMDVKAGSGAFMPTLDAASDLARALVEVAAGAGLPTTALVTDMDEPLASTAGNALEVRYALDHLAGRSREERFHAVTVALGGELLALADLVGDSGEGERRIAAAIDSGAAAERFARMVAALGGPSDLFERADLHLPPAPLVHPVEAERKGHVAAIDTRRLGLAVLALGGGRTQAGARIDPQVGLTALARRGDPVGPGQHPGERPLAIVHARDEASARAARALVRDAYAIGDPPAHGPVVLRRIALR